VNENGQETAVLNVGVVGCGLIGTRRAHTVLDSPTETLVAVADVNLEAAEQVAAATGAHATADWQDIVADDAVDVVIVATPNKFLNPITVAALAAGKHVLCEKPPGRNASETEQMVDAADAAGRLLKIGFNHRYHPAIWKAHHLVEEGAIGEPTFARVVYGHGGRPGYDQEWRASADLSGGGEMLDQGVHVIDLLRWFMGEFQSIYASTATYYWDLGYFDNGRRLEDNGFALLRTPSGQTAQLHTSWTQWKNRFTLEIFGLDGYLIMEGLGGSYGVETLTWGRRRPESGPPIIEVFEFDGPDLSWQREWSDFVGALRGDYLPLSHGADGLKTMKMISAFYESAARAEEVTL
jgi:predicted dehydrogenase